MENQVTVSDMEALVKSLADKRLEVETLKKPYSQACEELEAIEQKIVGTLEELGKDNYKSEFGTITRVNQWRFNLPKSPEDKAAYFEFLRQKGIFEQMATVNANTHNSFCKEEWEAAKQRDPMEALNFRIPGIEEAKLYRTLSFRKK
jgi:hypothetical protein